MNPCLLSLILQATAQNLGLKQYPMGNQIPMTHWKFQSDYCSTLQWNLLVDIEKWDR